MNSPRSSPLASPDVTDESVSKWSETESQHSHSDNSDNSDELASPLEALRLQNPVLKVLEGNELQHVVDYIKERNPKSWVILTGAGTSVSCGIPDFRTPETGLYSNLAKYGLPYPEAIFDIDYFKENPIPFSILAQAMFPGKFLPAPAHYLAKLVSVKGMLLRLYTQNIDTLDRLAGVAEDDIVEAHGSFEGSKCVGGYLAPENRTFTPSGSFSSIAEAASQSSHKTDSKFFRRSCGAVYETDWVRSELEAGRVPLCTKSRDGGVCQGLVKPNIVFFGESLPPRFDQMAMKDFARRSTSSSSLSAMETIRTCDLLIVMGTSLQVHPFAGLINLPGPAVPRLLINNECVGVYPPPLNQHRGFDFEGTAQAVRRDAFYKGGCDQGVLELCRLLGWEDEFTALMESSRAELRKKWGDFAIASPTTSLLEHEEMPEEDVVKKDARDDKVLAEETAELKLSESVEEADKKGRDEDEPAPDSAKPRPESKINSTPPSAKTATQASETGNANPPGASKLDRGAPSRMSVGIALNRDSRASRSNSSINLPAINLPLSIDVDAKDAKEKKDELFSMKDAIAVFKPRSEQIVTAGGVVLDLDYGDDVQFETEITI